MRKRQANLRSVTNKPTDYPAGTFIETEKGYFYIVQNVDSRGNKDTKRYRCVSRRVVDSWSPHRIVQTTERAVAHYRVAAKLKFRNGSLIHNVADGKIYLIVQGKRCPMVSPEAFERLGAEPTRKHVISVSKAEVEMHELGDEIS